MQKPLTEGSDIIVPQICILYHKLDIFFGKFKDFDTRLVCVGHLFNNFNCPAVRSRTMEENAKIQYGGVKHIFHVRRSHSLP